MSSSSTSTSSTAILNSNANAHKDWLLNKIGGKHILHQAVDLFYRKLVEDPHLEPFFRHANVAILKWHQFNIMSIAFTQVPDNVNVKDLILSKHRPLFEQHYCGLNETHFDIVLQHFCDTLTELDVDSNVIEDAKAVVAPLRDVFAHGQAAAQQQRQSQQQRRQALLVAGGAAMVVLVMVLVRRRMHHK